MTEKKKDNRGGAGRGQGRKPTGKKVFYENLTITALPAEKKQIKENAREKGKTVSRYLVELALRD